MDKNLLDIICCPLTQLPLQLLDAERLKLMNQAITAGRVRNRGETAITRELREALVTRDGRLVYPIRDGIPILLEAEAIDWKQMPE